MINKGDYVTKIIAKGLFNALLLPCPDIKNNKVSPKSTKGELNWFVVIEVDIF